MIWPAAPKPKIPRCFPSPAPLVAGKDRIGDVRKSSIDDMQIGPAHAAGGDFYAHIAGPGDRIFPRLKPKRRTGRRQDHGVHLVRYPHATVCSLAGATK